MKITFSRSVSHRRLNRLPDAGAVEAHGGLPDDLLEGRGFLEGGRPQASHQAAALPAVDLVLEQQLQEVDVAGLALTGVGGAIRQRRQQPPEPQALEAACQIRGDLHARPPR